MQSTLRGKNNRIGIICCCMLFLLLACCSLLLSSCGEEQKPKGRMVQVNYLSSDETGIEIHEYDKPSGDALEQVRTLMNYLGATPENLAFKSPLAMGFQVLGVEYQDGSLVLNVDEEYLKLSATTEVLVRAAIVRTLLQADGVSRMQILVAGNQLMDAAGELVGWMTADQFIHNDGSEINTYEQVRVKLYFANESGDHLVAAYREKFYSTNTPLERFVVDEILSGPSGTIAGLYASVNGDTKILSVMTKDGICYVNFDAKFLEATGNVTMEVAIYSIVNSLTELPNIHHVQILVNGEIPDVFPQAVFEKNMDLVTLLEQTPEPNS
ncbi:MAG: GerMN domain-containing protein [Lachnospiraceae bacterium]|nr:GerMN domain-containing protein [Lachnospiraceae bacterium]